MSQKKQEKQTEKPTVSAEKKERSKEDAQAAIRARAEALADQALIVSYAYPPEFSLMPRQGVVLLRRGDNWFCRVEDCEGKGNEYPLPKDFFVGTIWQNFYIKLKQSVPEKIIYHRAALGDTDEIEALFVKDPSFDPIDDCLVFVTYFDLMNSPLALYPSGDKIWIEFRSDRYYLCGEAEGTDEVRYTKLPIPDDVIYADSLEALTGWMATLKEKLFHTALSIDEKYYLEFLHSDKPLSAHRPHPELPFEGESYSYPIVSDSDGQPKIPDFSSGQTDIREGAKNYRLEDWMYLSDDAYRYFIDYVQRRAVCAVQTNIGSHRDSGKPVFCFGREMKPLRSQSFMANHGFYCFADYYEDTVTGLIAVCWWGDWVGRPAGTESERTYFLTPRDYSDAANLMCRLLCGHC